MFNLKTKNLFYFLMVFFIFLFFPGCKKQNTVKLINHTQEKIVLTDLNFKLFIEGIECIICSKKAVSILEKIENIHKVDLTCLNNNFENSHLNLTLKTNQNVNIKKIREELNKKEFFLKSISGEFIGTFSGDGNYFKLLQDEHLYKVKCLNNNFIKDEKLQLVKGRIELSDNKNWLII